MYFQPLIVHFRLSDFIHLPPLHRHLSGPRWGPGAVQGAEMAPGALPSTVSALWGLCLLLSAVLSLQVSYCHDISPTCEKVTYPVTCFGNLNFDFLLKELVLFLATACTGLRIAHLCDSGSS